MSTEQIAAGLAARNGSGSLKPALSPSDLQNLAVAASKVVSTVNQAHAKADEALAEKFTEIADQEDEAGILEARPNGIIVRRPASELAIIKKAFDSQRAKATKQVRADTQALLDEQRGKLKASLDAAKESPLGNAHAWASQHGVGSAEVDSMIRRFSMMGPAALRHAAANALASKSKPMVAALVAVNDSSKTRDRAFASAELAEAAFGEEASKGQGAIKVIEKSVADLEIVRRELSQGATIGSVGGAKIVRGLIADDGEAWGGSDAA